MRNSQRISMLIGVAIASSLVVSHNQITAISSREAWDLNDIQPYQTQKGFRRNGKRKRNPDRWK
jgi:hypothetical protein